MLMSGGTSFQGNSGTIYGAGTTPLVGPGDVRQALINGWVPSPIQPSSPSASFPAMIVVTPSGDTTGSTDTAALTSAGTQLLENGGGIVQLTVGKYYINAVLPSASGLAYLGVAPQLNLSTATIPDSGSVAANGGGTVLQAVGSTACFQWNKTALGVGTANGFVLTGLNGIALKNLCLNGFTRAIDAGNTNNASAWYSEFENLFISNCTDWGLWVTNFQHCKFRRIFTFSNTNGGQYYGNDVPSTTLQPGNSVWEDVYNVTPSASANFSQGITFFIVQGQQNEGLINRVQSNRQNSSVITQAATMSNGSANISVTDVSKFPVGMPCTFSASVNGVFQNEIYFVVSNPGGSGVGNITVSLTYGGSAVSGTGATAVNIIQQGYAALAVIANPGAAISCHDFHNIDVEGGGTAAIIAQNVQTSKFEISQVPLAAQSTQSFCARSLQFSQVFARASINTSWDGSSGSSQLFGNRASGSVGGGAVAHNPPGFYFDAGDNFTELNLTASVKGLSNQTTQDTTNVLIPLTGLAMRQQNKAAAAVSLAASDSGIVINAYTAGTATWTFPNASSTMKGVGWRCINPVGTGQNLVITTTGATTNFFGPSSGRTSITMTPGSSMDIYEENDALGSYIAVGNLVGSYTTGTLTGITP
jgi:hypothetical protein